MTSETASAPVGATTGIFDDVARYVAMPRLSGLTLSPSGDRLVTTVATLNRKKTGYVSAVWEIDPTGEHPPRRLTRSSKGETATAFTVDGDLLFTSARPNPESDEDDKPEAALWLIPAGGGEARVVLSRPAGVGSVKTARAHERVVTTAGRYPAATSEEEHAAIHRLRTETGVDAILHDSYPIRFWDADIGPLEPHLFVVEEQDQDAAGADAVDPTQTRDRVAALSVRDVTPDRHGRALLNSAPEVSPDGRYALLGVNLPEPQAGMRTALVRVDLSDGTSRVLLDEPGQDFAVGPISPDSGTALVVREPHTSPTQAPRPELQLLEVSTGELTPLAADWDRWIAGATWSPDGASLIVHADQNGRHPIFQISVADGSVRQITEDDASYTDVSVHPDGVTAFALRNSYQLPPEPVRIDLSTGEVTPLVGPVQRPSLPGTLTEVSTTTADGTTVRGWLALPESAGSEPAPLLLWIHGGPLSSWNSWTWRWNPWLMVSQGYAVLLPDPALSTGYGRDFIQRGWGQWGQSPYTDLMAITDEVVARADIDETRTAAMGGSFGGYMANWIAGHTDRFNAIVTHASLWALDQFGPTTDAAFYWRQEMTPEMAAANSPHASIDKIVTPMLVIHGDKDYRVPIGEGLRLWYELLSASGSPTAEDGSTVHRFLYFPHENHWILAPQHAIIWYQVVSNFLADQVLGSASGPQPAALGLSVPTEPEVDRVDSPGHAETQLQPQHEED